MIKLFRIDHRLLHGQVAFSWIKSIGADCILVADDEATTNSLKMTTLRLAKPQGVKLVVKSIDDSIKALQSGVTDKYKLFIVTGSVADAKRICDAVPEIKSINLGGIKNREGARQVSQAIFLLPEEEDELHELAANGVELEIRQAAALGARDLVVVPGNYGSDYVSGNLRIGAVPVVACSNFMGAAIDCAAREGFERVLVVGHIGKMVKVCGGIMDTHSRVADARMEILAAHAAASGAPAERVRQIMDAATADAGLEILQREGLVAPTCESLSRALSIRLGRRAGRAMSVAAIVFSNVYGELFRTPGADAMLAAWEVAHG